MKLRIHNNSIRLRLSRSEVSQFQEAGHISDVLDFGTMGKFTYGLTMAEEFTFHCTYDQSQILLKVPRQLALVWATTNQVDLSTEQTLDSGGKLQLLVEKDFQCIHKDSESNSDAYPNPLQTESQLTST